jgi:hypothetical protein
MTVFAKLPFNAFNANAGQRLPTRRSIKVSTGSQYFGEPISSGEYLMLIRNQEMKNWIREISLILYPHAWLQEYAVTGARRGAARQGGWNA